MTRAMYMSKLYAPTLKEDPADAELASHRLLLRAGMIRKEAAGLYSYLPLAWRSIRKIENIVRDEMDAAGAQELMMPIMVDAELWRESGRIDAYGKELVRFDDRHGREFVLGPTTRRLSPPWCAMNCALISSCPSTSITSRISSAMSSAPALV